METVVTTLDQLGKRLARRRVEAGLSHDELAGAAKIRQADLVGHETGRTPLPVSALARLANALGVPVAGLVDLASPEVRAPKEAGVLLKTLGLTSVHSDDLALLSNQLARARAFSVLGEILAVEHLEPSFSPSQAPRDKAYLNGYQAANDARRLLLQREGTVRGLRRLIENRFNTLVVRVPFSSKEILGASCRSANARLIALNSGIVHEGRRRFVLAHELCHQLLDLDTEGAIADLDEGEPATFWMENPPVERRANAFAAMFLASEQAVRSVLGPPRSEGYGLDDARSLTLQGQKHFGLSFSAMAWHLHNLQYIKTPDTVKSLLVLPEGSEVVTFEDETRFDGLERRALEAVAKERISQGRASELLGHPFEELTEGRFD